MKKALFFTLACAGLLQAQLGQTTDWIAFGGNAQRDGFEKNDHKFTKDDVKDFRLLWQRQLENPKHGVGALLPPAILGQLIGYRGFKELAFVAGSGNTIWSMDSDLDRIYFTKHFDVPPRKGTCPGSLTAMPALPAPIVFRMPPPAPAAAAPAPAAGANPATPATPARRNSAVASFARPHPFFVLTGDGMLHRLYQADGSEMGSPVPFIPAGVVAQPLNVYEETVYTSTRGGCGHDPAIWSVDTSEPTSKVKSFTLPSDAVGLGGVVLGSDGTAFVQTEDGTLLGLNQDLSVTRTFVLPESSDKKTKSADTNFTSPLVFTFKGQELVATSGRDGRVYLLQASTLGGEDHHQFLSKSLVLPALDGNKSHGMWGALSTWEDTDGSRYLLAPVWGPLSAELQSAVTGTDAPHGSVVAFKLDAKDGAAPTLTPAWVSRDLESPVPPVIAKGVVFALSSGKFTRSGKELENPVKGSHATLFALDGVTGKELYSTGDQVTTAGNLTGLSIANARVYFCTVDNTVHVFGKYLER